MYLFAGSRKWLNIATNQIAWASYTSSAAPSKIVDGDQGSYGSSGEGPGPFVAVDLGKNVPVGTLIFIIKKGELYIDLLIWPSWKSYPT